MGSHHPGPCSFTTTPKHGVFGGDWAGEELERKGKEMSKWVKLLQGSPKEGQGDHKRPHIFFLEREEEGGGGVNWKVTETGRGKSGCGQEEKRGEDKSSCFNR